MAWSLTMMPRYTISRYSSVRRGAVLSNDCDLGMKTPLQFLARAIGLGYIGRTKNNAGSEYRSPAQMKRVKTMSHYMTALAMQQKGLKPATKVVLYWLADHHNSETGLCFPSLGILAEECDLDRSTVIRHIAILEGKGLLMRVHRKRK